MKLESIKKAIEYWWYFQSQYQFPFRHIRRAYYWIQHRINPKHKYNTIYLKLKPGYYDPDVRIRHALFEELVRFLDNAQIDWKATPKHLAVYNSLKEAYDWWIVGRPEMVEAEEKSLMVWYDYSYGDTDTITAMINDLGSKAEESKRLLEEHTKIESEIARLDKHYLKIIIDNMDCMWYP